MTGRILVAHHLWKIGGETNFNIELIKTLCSLEYKISIASVTDLSNDVIKEVNNIGCIESIIQLLPFKLSYGAQIQRALLGLSVLKATKNINPDIVWIDSVSYIPFKDKFNKGTKIIHYIHFPQQLINKIYIHKLPKHLMLQVYPYFMHYWSGILKNMYSQVSYLTQKSFGTFNPFKYADVVLANSKFIATLIESLLGEKPLVLYPPVDTEKYSINANKAYYERNENIVMIGRISQEKNYETVIKAISLTKNKPNIYLIGYLSPSAKRYLIKLKKLAKEKNINLNIYINASKNDIIKVMSESRIFVHPTIGEHFGISIVEAMASGLPVIVHKSGGPYYDIIDKGKYGLYFTDALDLAEKIDTLLNNESKWKKYSEKSIERMKYFTLKKFEERIKYILNIINI